MPRRERSRSAFEAAPPPAVSYLGDTEIDLRFDYELVEEQHREQVRSAARAIKPRLKRAVEDIFVIGRELIAVREYLPYGTYTDWLEVEFGMSPRQSYRFINVAERLSGSSAKLAEVPASALYMLAEPSTPDEAIEIIEGKVTSGERVRLATVREVISETKQEARRSVPAKQRERELRTDATRQLERAINRVVALLGEDSLLEDDEREEAWAMMMQLRQAVRQRMP